MSSSITRSFTKTEARYVSSKIVTVLKLMRLFYGSPSETMLERFGLEAELLLAAGYLKEVTYGFRRGADFVPGVTYRYVAVGAGLQDDLPGGVLPGMNIGGAAFHSFLEYNAAFDALSIEDRRKFEATLPFQRGVGTKLGTGGGVWVNEKSYSASGQGVTQSVLKPL
jgi:hypothetical protein